MVQLHRRADGRQKPVDFRIDARAALVQRHALKAIFIEASYPNSQPRTQLFGHLTPELLLQELVALGQLVGPRSLRGLPVVITHLKPTPGNEALIRQQLAAGNALGVQLVFPEQGRALQF